MDQGNRVSQPTNDKLVYLKREQKQYHEDSFEQVDIQAKIDQIVAERYLEYVNR